MGKGRPDALRIASVSNKPAVSWLLTVKNGMPFLTETLAALEAQTFRDSEIVVWLIESSDGTEEELHRWIPQRLPGRIYKSGPLGLGASRAKMVELAQADLCACIDADDISEPHRLERQVAFLKAHPEIALVGSDVRIIDERGNFAGNSYLYPADHEGIEHMLIHSNAIAHPSVLMRREAVLAAGNYVDEAPIEDYDLWLRLAVSHRLANISEPLVRYRVHSLSHTRRLAIDLVNNRTTQTFANRAEPLFGIDTATAKGLSEASLPRSATVAIKIARHLGKRRSQSWLKVLRTPSFVASLRRQTTREDRFSQIFYDFLLPRPGAPRETWLDFREAMIVNTPPGRWLRRRRKEKHMRAQAGAIADQ